MNILISEILNIRALDDHIATGYISKRHHPDAPLHLYDYTPKAQYERIWTPETIACRGLVVHNDGRVWARPFGKFFNASEHTDIQGLDVDARRMLAPLPIHEPFEVFDKLDGSLGIAYRNPVTQQICVSTRGSFGSEQALHATALVRDRYRELDTEIGEDETWLFEIIYPTNRIVVNYGDRDELVLLAIIDIRTGLDRALAGPERWSGPTVMRHDNLRDWKALVDQHTASAAFGDDAEGYVVRFASGIRAKIKFNDYLRLHRLVTGVSSVTIWEHLSAGLPFDEILDRVPDEFFAWVKHTAVSLRAEYDAVESQCRLIFEQPEVDQHDRKATALFFADKPHRAVLFKMYDSKPYGDLIWRLIKPEFSRPFRVNEDGAAEPHTTKLS
jgi:RNA ligase